MGHLAPIPAKSTSKILNACLSVAYCSKLKVSVK
jgi:hypothetical protein